MERQLNLNLGCDMARELENVTPELVQAIVITIAFHVGHENIISGPEFVRELQSQGHKVNSRSLRLAISKIVQKTGYPIAGTGGIMGGYWLLKDRNEAEQYMKVQLHEPGITLLQREAAIRKGFARWYPGDQLTLSGKAG